MEEEEAPRFFAPAVEVEASDEVLDEELNSQGLADSFEDDELNNDGYLLEAGTSISSGSSLPEFAPEAVNTGRTPVAPEAVNTRVLRSRRLRRRR